MIAGAAGAALTITGSRDFAKWLAGLSGSLALTTYQAGRLVILGTDSEGRVTLFERNFSRPMGIAVDPDGNGFALASQFEIHRFDNILRPGSRRELVATEARAGDSFDSIFAPRLSWVTGMVDAHEVGLGPDGRPFFVATLYSCIAEVSDRFSFHPVWRPPFVSALVAEDRCHLNGMALCDGQPAYATAFARSDVKEGWRAEKEQGGLLIDVASGEIACAGLSMPHSPRLHDGRLWLCNSGSGEFGHVDLATGKFVPVAFCPGYARGVVIREGVAIIGLSGPRSEEGFAGLPLAAALAARGLECWCGLLAIDLASGATVAWARFDGSLHELFDVVLLPGKLQPALIGFRTDEIKHTVALEA